MLAAPHSAIFICPDGGLTAYRDRANKVGRTDLNIQPASVLQPDSIDRLRGLPSGRVLIADHSVQLTVGNIETASKFGLMLNQAVPEKLDQQVPKALRRIQADIISYRLGRTGIILRDEQGKPLGELLLRSVAHEGTDDRVAAEALIKDVADLIEQKNSSEASVLPQHKL